MLSTAVETLGFVMLAAGAGLKFGPWAGLLVAGAALVLLANFATLTPRKRTRTIRIPAPQNGAGPFDLAAALTNGELDGDQA